MILYTGVYKGYSEIADTIGQQNFVRFSEVSVIQREYIFEIHKA